MLREIPIHESAHRPILLWGGDRQLMLFVTMLSVVMIGILHTWASTWTGILLYFAARRVLVIMAKADPLMRQVYFDNRRYNAQGYFPARSTPYVVRSGSYGKS